MRGFRARARSPWTLPTATRTPTPYGSGEKNTRGAPPGSGFYVVGLDAGECFARTAMLWGCEFDETGAESKCGEAIIDMATGALEITTIQPID
jgi:hypothetical protein